MAMNVGSSGDEDEVVSTINTTPLVDVMLVLLIIFLITIPVVTHTVPVELPKETNIAAPDQAGEHHHLGQQGRRHLLEPARWSPTATRCSQRLSKIATMKPQPEVHIRGDEKARYESIGRVLFQCQRAAIQKVSFITEPPPKG